MAAEGIFSKFERDELNKITAKSILEKLMNIRQNINVEFTARRLIWELLQNAKDNANLCNADVEKVDATIQLTKTDFIFSHNKGYFTNEHIRGLIRKYSSSDKNRDLEQEVKVYKTTGRFGTGFMTTHLLSEKVKLESYYKDENGSFRKFNFWLDRSGKGENEIIQGINNAFDEAETNIRRSESFQLAKDEFETSFTYPLTEQKKSLANIALDEVEKGLAYTLINVPEINSVTIDREGKGESIYKIQIVNTISYLGNEFIIYNLLINNERSKYYYISLYDNELHVIIPIAFSENNYYTLELDSTVPRLHLDFPMIGTEGLNLPFVINNPLFEPTEPRDGISLMGEDDNDVSRINCNIVIRAVELYNQFITYVGENDNWKDLYNLARIKAPKKRTWIDNDWFTFGVVQPIRSKLLNTPIVDVTNGDRISIWNENNECQVYFPCAENENIRKELWRLTAKLHPQYTPIKEHINQWYEIIRKDCYKFSISELSEEIHGHETLTSLEDYLKDSGLRAMDFLNSYYALLNSEKIHIKDIIANEFKVIPNQLGEFKNKSDLFIDEKIDEEIKNACAIISNDPKSYLIHKEVNTGVAITYNIKKNDTIIKEINNVLKESKHENIPTACDYLASLFTDDDFPEKRKSIFNFSKLLYPDDFKHKRSLKYYDELIWEESDKKSLFYIVSKIAEFITVEKASEELGFENKNAFLSWLDSLVTFLVKEGFDININREKYPILPNQKGIFTKKEHLFLDDGSIGDALKDISEELGYDFRDELLSTKIYLELPENRVYTIENVAEKISTYMKPIIRDVDKRKEYKNTLKKFYLWMDGNRSKAEQYFFDLFEKKFLFLEDDDISYNMKKATELDSLIAEHGFKNIEELRNHLLETNKSSSSQKDEIEKVNLTKEILVSLGISSQKELEEAFKDPVIAGRFYHTSTPTTDMFIYAQRLIERAKDNIIKHLKNHPDYDCTDIEETAPTILAGISKNGIPIQIVTRPSDNGEVIIYYSSEKDTLDSDNAELWVDNSSTEPHILTLGRILKSTGINRIPINMN